jgi:hypothetical protein
MEPVWWPWSIKPSCGEVAVGVTASNGASEGELHTWCVTGSHGGCCSWRATRRSCGVDGPWLGIAECCTWNMTWNHFGVGGTLGAKLGEVVALHLAKPSCWGRGDWSTWSQRRRCRWSWTGSNGRGLRSEQPKETPRVKKCLSGDMSGQHLSCSYQWRWRLLDLLMSTSEAHAPIHLCGGRALVIENDRWC